MSEKTATERKSEVLVILGGQAMPVVAWQELDLPLPDGVDADKLSSEVHKWLQPLLTTWVTEYLKKEHGPA